MYEEIITIMGLWLIYSFMGFIVETIFVSVGQGHFVQRGFLTGPIIPIYGFGALIVLYLLKPVHNNMALVFIFGLISTSALEYFGSYVMEKFFGLKLWDYSSYPMNLNGRICLRNSVLFAILCVLLEFYINPEVFKIIHMIPVKVFNNIVIGLMILAIIDTTISVMAAMHIKTDLNVLKAIKSHMPLPNSLSKEVKAGNDNLVFVRDRLFKAFPNMKHAHVDNVVSELKDHYNKSI